MQIIKRLFFFALCSSFIVACGPSKKVHEDRIYLRGIDEVKDQSYKIPDPVIQIGDLLAIRIFSNSPEATALFNQGAGSSSSGGGAVGNSAAGTGYQVDVQGNIYFFKIGAIKASGLTKLQLVQALQDKLATYLTNPYVEVNFLNTKVTVMGEVSKPGTINITEQRISILDALAQSGDLTNFGRRDNILVVREKDGKREIGRLDLRSPSIMQSEFFYLQQNDLVYVEPQRKKPLGNEQTVLRNVSIATSIISTVAILFSIFRR